MHKKLSDIAFLILTLIFYFTLSLAELCYAQWTQNTGIKGGDINTFISDGTKIYTGLYGGGIYASDNGGLTWERKNNGLDDFYVSSLLVKDEYLFAGFTSSGVFVSSDQGETWNASNFGLHNRYVSAMAEIDSFIFVAMYNEIYVSADYGKHWSWSFGLTGNSFGSFLTKDSVIFSGTYNGVFFSSNYGGTWIERSEGLTTKNINALTCIGNKIFAATADGYVYVSSNDGLNWTPAGAGLPVPNIISIHSADSVLYAGPFGKGIYISSDLGNSWIPFNEGYNEGSTTTSFVNFGNSVFAGCESGVFEIKAGETIWSERNEGIYGTSFGCIEINDGKIYLGAPGGSIWISSDMGVSWEGRKVINSFESVNGIAFNGDTIYAITSFDAFFSTDQGNSWDHFNFYIDNISSIAVKGNKIFLGSYDEGIWLSTDGGLSWYEKNTGLLNHGILTLGFDDINIYAGSFEGLFISSDDGENWINAVTGIPPTSFIGTIEVTGENIYAGGFDGIYLSVNKGSSWTNKGFSTKIVGRVTALGDNVYAGVSPGGVYRSTNKGTQWQLFNEGLMSDGINSLLISDTLLFAGNSGFGLWTRSIALTGIEPGNKHLPENFILKQNFPNPFNPATKIEFHIPDFGYVSLKVYDALGREVSVLVNEEKSPGVYEVGFDASYLSSGIYFYKLQTEKHTSVKKMILVK